MTKANEMMNHAVEVLVANGMEKTGYRIPFVGYQDLKIDEVEMLEFLFQFDRSMERFEELVKEDKGLGVHMPIMKLMYYLNQTHNFGFLNRNKVEILDTVSDISEIQMKPRHLVFLDILKGIKPNMETMFVEAYNQTQPHINPFRIEQVLFYLRESLEYEDIKTNYKDFIAAVPHFFTGDWKPYSCRSNYGFYVIDNKFGGYSGSLYITDVDKGEKPQWYYGSSNGVDRWHGHESTAIAQVEKLRALNGIAGIEGLEWEIIFANRHDVPFRTGYHGLYQDIPKGKITLYKKLEREILRSQKLCKRSA